MIMSPSAEIRIDALEFDHLINTSPLPVLVEMGAPWCAPCRRMQPLLAHLAGVREDIRIVSIDLDENRSIAERFQVDKIPTFMIFSGGSLRERLSGELHLSSLTALIDRNTIPPF